MDIIRCFIYAAVLIGLSSCSRKITSTYDYLALGDSYTIGESVEEAERWPVNLASQLRNQGVQVYVPTIVATSGWTTDELMLGIEEANLTEHYDLVSLLIGVNDQYRGYPFENYEAKFEKLLKTALSYANQDAESVFVLSIPDYGVTPFGELANPQKIANELDNYNAVAKEVCESYGVAFYNITEISRLAADDKSLIALDQLHPSGKMYAMWVDAIIDEVKAKLK